MVYNKLVIPKQNPTAAASLISPAPTFLANNAGNEKIANPCLVISITLLCQEVNTIISGSAQNSAAINVMTETTVIRQILILNVFSAVQYPGFRIYNLQQVQYRLKNP